MLNLNLAMDASDGPLQASHRTRIYAILALRLCSKVNALIWSFLASTSHLVVVTQDGAVQSVSLESGKMVKQCEDSWPSDKHLTDLCLLARGLRDRR